jgi:hypothetical protein
MIGSESDMALTVSWFSAGVSSAVATKLAIDDIDKIIYTHIEDQHEDTMRFVRDCEEWFGKPVEIISSPLKNVESACYMAGGRGYINGVAGAACTKRLKRDVRKQWEADNITLGPFTYVWGIDSDETSRAEKITKDMSGHTHLFPLIEGGINKEHAHRIIRASGIARPAMYDLGYHNNNCVGCVKGGMGYWNKIRTDFPGVFKARAKMERTIGASCINGTYLDELDPDRGRHADEVMDDCGIFCELIRLD